MSRFFKSITYPIKVKGSVRIEPKEEFNTSSIIERGCDCMVMTTDEVQVSYFGTPSHPWTKESIRKIDGTESFTVNKTCILTYGIQRKGIQ